MKDCRQFYIDGKWVASDSGRTLAVTNPATEETLAEVAYGGRAETRRAVEAAARAMPAWMKMTAWERAKILKKTADLVPFSFDPDWLGLDDEFPDNETGTPCADDIIFGGLGGDFLHGGRTGFAYVIAADGNRLHFGRRRGLRRSGA